MSKDDGNESFDKLFTHYQLEGGGVGWLTVWWHRASKSETGSSYQKC